jgi:hypothetical protein
MVRLVVAALLVLAVTACGGGDRGDSEPDPAAKEDPSTLPDPGPGLGEAGPPPAIAAGWKTDFDRRAVPLSEFQSGGPGKDGIPPIDSPRFLPADAVAFLEPNEPVIAVELNGEARAYPIQILVWHEIVNDSLGGVPIAVTFCPLCNTAIAFDRRVDGRTLDFGTTGNLRNADLVMYDRQTESWWQQFGGRALVGELTGERLEQVAARIVAWREYRGEHPRSDVLSTETGHDRPYGENPYLGYDDIESPPFVRTRNSGDDRLPPKERVVFIERADTAVAIPYSVLRERRVVRLELAGRRLVVRWRAGVASPLDAKDVPGGRDVGTAEVLEEGRLVPFDEPFWFAVAAFRPDVRIVR